MLFDLRGQPPPRGPGDLPDAGRADGRRPGAVRHRRRRQRRPARRLQGRRRTNGEQSVQKRIDRSEERLEANPQHRRRWRRLVRDNYQLGRAPAADPTTGSSPRTPRTSSRRPTVYWKRYLEAPRSREPDASLGQRHDPGVRRGWRLNKPAGRKRGGAAIVAGAHANELQTYVQLVQYATLAGDKRTAELAAQKAVDACAEEPAEARSKQAGQAGQGGKPAAQRSSAGRRAAADRDRRSAAAAAGDNGPHHGEKRELPHQRRSRSTTTRT